MEPPLPDNHVFTSCVDVELSSEDEVDLTIPTPSTSTMTGIKARTGGATVGVRGGKASALKSMTESDNVPAAPKRNPARKKGTVPRAPALDFSTLPTCAPREPAIPARPQGTRLFGLEHAPVYHPTVREFAQPMEYIERISVEAKEYGICKIVPPVGWRPPFALDTTTFRFKTRLQLLNSMEASARASLNFLEQLYIFHRQQGIKEIIVPTVQGKPIDLWRLRKEVSGAGGYAKVSSDRLWPTIAMKMGYEIRAEGTVLSDMKNTFAKLVVPFEAYIKRIKENAALSLDPIFAGFALSPPNTPKDSNGADSLATPSSEVPPPIVRGIVLQSTKEGVRTASDKLNEALGTGASSLPSPDTRGTAEETPGDVCEICALDHDPDQIVLCDGCDRGYHLNCLSPPLEEVPSSQFYCDACLLMNGADYGFEEGEEHSLHSYRRRADAFKKKWLQDHPIPMNKGKGKQENGMQTDEEAMADQIRLEDHFEREFWRCVESQTESVEVEYGADVNYTKDGGGLPNLENNPTNPYSRDGWNLNNLPILSGSLLRYIKSDISGMTIPWIYVGMVFSTFAWHKEDHYTYSINYHQFGDTKTWYGIPGADDEKLEAAMTLAAPELFEQQPDLMFQLVTLMSPGRLKQHGVRVVACDQRPNEFVITFPRAYHSGFNHGFNFNEAVNFALPDWLPTGLKCVNRYRDIKKNPVFSHDELLVTISQHEKSPRNSRWLLPSWREMVDREIASRKLVRSTLQTQSLHEFVDESDIEEEEFQCGFCKTLCYLSQLKTVGQPEIACLDHSDSLPRGPKSLRLRYSDTELRAMLARVKTRSDKAGKRPGPLLLSTAASEVVHGSGGGKTSGRKRKPSTIAREAADGVASSSPPTQRVKRDVEEEALDDIDGVPYEAPDVDVDGEPMDEELDGRPIILFPGELDDIDGEPMPYGQPWGGASTMLAV